MDGWVDIWMYEWLDGRMDIRMVGWVMDWWIDGWEMDCWTDGCLNE
jgi:hypothetical protein